jgi:hypothetical protein
MLENIFQKMSHFHKVDGEETMLLLLDGPVETICDEENNSLPLETFLAQMGGKQRVRKCV